MVIVVVGLFGCGVSGWVDGLVDTGDGVGPVGMVETDSDSDDTGVVAHGLERTWSRGAQPLGLVRDVFGDGFDDLVLFEGGDLELWSGPIDRVGAPVVRWSAIASDGGRPSQAAAGDFGGGTPELVVAVDDDLAPVWLLSLGSSAGEPVPVATLSSPWEVKARIAEPEDLDGDGRVDLPVWFVAQDERFEGEAAVYDDLRPDTNEPDDAAVRVTAPIGAYDRAGFAGQQAAVALGDLDGDGATDLALFPPDTSDQGTPPSPWATVFSEPRGDVLLSDGVALASADGYAIGHQVADVDGDGYLDLALTSSGGTGAVLPGPVTAGEEPTLTLVSTGGYVQWVGAGDVDGDGARDLLVLAVGDGAGGHATRLDPEVTGTVDVAELPSSSASGVPIAVGDVDSVRGLDLVLSFDASSMAMVYGWR